MVGQTALRGFVCLLIIWSLQASAYASDSLTKYTWADTLELPKVRGLIVEAFAARKADPKNFEITDRLARLCSYAWRLEKEDNKQRMEYAKCLYQVGNDAITLKPEHPLGHLTAAMGLGGMALIRGILPSLQHVPQGKKFLEKSIELDPEYRCSMGLALIGRAYAVVPPFPMSIGDKKKAIANIKHSQKICPRNSLALVALADLLWDLKQNDEALALLQQLGEIKPESEIEYFLLEVNKRKAKELTDLIKSGASRDPFYDILSDSTPGIGLQ